MTIPLGSEKEEPEVAEKHHGDSDEYVSFQYLIILMAVSLHVPW